MKFLICMDVRTGETGRVVDDPVTGFCLTNDTIYYLPQKLRYFYVPEDYEEHPEDVVVTQSMKLCMHVTSTARILAKCIQTRSCPFPHLPSSTACYAAGCRITTRKLIGGTGRHSLVRLIWKPTRSSVQEHRNSRWREIENYTCVHYHYQEKYPVCLHIQVEGYQKLITENDFNEQQDNAVASIFLFGFDQNLLQDSISYYN